MTTTRERFVNTASAGGDGTTRALSGANAAYANLNAALDAEQGDVSTATGSDELVWIRCAGSAADTVAPTFSATWKMDNGGYVLIEPDEGQEHGGKYNTSVYRIELSTSTSATFSPLPTTNQFRAMFVGVQLKITRTGSNVNNTVMFNTQSGMIASSRFYMERCIIVIDDTGYSGTGSIRYIFQNTANCRLLLSNNLFTGATTGGLTGLVSVSTNGQAEIYNCTFINNRLCLSGMNASFHRVKNCLFNDNVDDITGTEHSASDFNATDLASGLVGANSRFNQTFTFRNEGAGDYHLAAGDTGAKGFGTDLSADPQYIVTKDVDGATRADPWDIGFDAFSAEGFILYEEDGFIMAPLQRHGEVQTLYG